MIEQEKYVKVIVNPLEPAREPTSGVMINNLDITITENGVYEAESPYTGYGTVTVAVPDTPVVINPLSITPSTSQQTFTASGGVNGYSPVTVGAVTSSIDSNIKSNNIKSGVSILGVSGSVVEAKLQSYADATPATFQYTLVPSSQYNGFAEVRVRAVTSSIDSNITAGNIKSGVTILGVTGTYSPALPYPYRKMRLYNNTLYSASIDSFALDVGNLTFTDVGFYGLNCIGYALVYTGNISFDDLTIVSGERAFNYAFGGANITGKITLNNLTNVTGYYAFYYAFFNSTVSQGIEFNGLVTISNYSSNLFNYTFGSCNANVYFNNLEAVNANYCFSYGFISLRDCTVYLPKLKTVSGTYAFQYAFQGDQYTAIEYRKAPYISGLFNSLESVTSSSAFRYAFQYNHHITGAITFSKLNTISAGSIFSNAFRGCVNMTSLSFPALTSTSFGTATTQFDSMLSGCTGVTVHFPSNLQSVIGSWTSVTGGFSGTNTTVLFDLTATS